MSKNTASNAFRKIDVDAFNEDNFRDEDTAGTGPQPGQGGAVASEAQIGTWIQEGKTVEALQALLSQAPIANKNQQEKVSGCNMGFGKVLTSGIRLNRLSPFLGCLSPMDERHMEILSCFIDLLQMLILISQSTS